MKEVIFPHEVTLASGYGTQGRSRAERVLKDKRDPRMALSQIPHSRERRATLDLFEALGSSLDIEVVLNRMYPALLRLVPADYGALGISSSGMPRDFEWIVANLPSAFFSGYGEIAAHDFVRDAVARRPNVVLRDHDMISRSALTSNVMYHRAREVGAPMEQVMAVMLHVDRRWQSGLSLYRERRRPFTVRQRQTLQGLTPVLANAVRTCHLFGASSDWARALESLLADRSAAILLMALPATEVARTAGASRLIDRWFAPHERPGGGCPDALGAAFRCMTAAREAGQPVTSTWTRRGAAGSLEASFLSLSGAPGKATWMVVLKEVPQNPGLPLSWKTLLTPRECEVATVILRGWDNALIAHELGCATTTVKRHVTAILDKLGLSSRTALVARAVDQKRA